jgi:predicted methyltransferase
MDTFFAAACILDRLRVTAACGLFAVSLAVVDCGGAPREPVAPASPATLSKGPTPGSPPPREGVKKNVIRVDRELEDPLPLDARELDVVLDVLFYHDTVWLKADRARMNASIFAALKHGGVDGIIDHSGRDATGATETKSLHRIEEKIVRDEIVKAGFNLAGEGTFLRNPKDTRDWNAAPVNGGERRGATDRFVLKFVKP